MVGILFIAFASFLWAFDALIRYPLLGSGTAPIKIVLIEHIILTALLAPVFIKSFDKFWSAKVSHVFYFFVIGGLGSGIATLCFTKAFTLINPSVVILLQKLQPIVAIILAKIFLAEKIKREFIFWAFLCLLGGLAVSLSDIFAGGKFSFSLQSKNDFIGYGLITVSVIAWGASTVFGKKLTLSNYNHKEIMSGRFIMGLLTILPIFIYDGGGLGMAALSYGKILAMVLMSGLLAMYLYYRGLKLVTARLAALVEMLFPFCAVIVNWIFLGATLSVWQIAGGLLLLFSALIIQLRRC